MALRRHRTLKFLAAALTGLLLPRPGLAQKPGALDARLDRPPFDRQFWGVALVDERGKLLFGRNQSRLFIPASNTKLIVSAVASALFPPEWTVRTPLNFIVRRAGRVLARK